MNISRLGALSLLLGAVFCANFASVSSARAQGGDDAGVPAEVELPAEAEPPTEVELANAGDDWIDSGLDELPPPVEQPADTAPDAEPTTDESAPQVLPTGTGEEIRVHRQVPDYDGLPEPGLSATEALLWIPRILTAPLYLISEFLIRRPLGWLITELEQTDLLGLAQEIFTFADNRIGLFPTAFFEFGFVPSFGLYGFWNEFIVEQNRLSAHAGTFGPGWLSLVIKDQLNISDDVFVRARFNATRRPDYLFGGIGRNVRTGDSSRYGMSHVEASLDAQGRFWRRSRLTGLLGFRSASFHNEGYLGGPPIGDVVIAQGRALPDAFTTGYTAIRAEAEVIIDTREVADRPAGGVAVHAFARGHGAIEGGGAFHEWVDWGGALAGFTDVLGDHRVLSLQLDAEFISAVDASIVPFNELIDIGGLGPLEGFLPGMLRGRSMIALSAAYKWPVWVFLDGRLHFTVGNAFSDHLGDFDPADLRMSFGIAVEPAMGGELPFELGVALGTETFSQGAEITSLRFVVGARNGL